MLELSQVARVSRLELSQFELYSARVREFEAWGRQSHPRTDGHGSEYARTLNSSQWQLLGNFTGGRGAGRQHSRAVAAMGAVPTLLLTLLPFRPPPLYNHAAEKAKGSQTFALERPQWMRYLLLRFLSQHGAEPVCAVNGISVYGKSAAEELEDQLASAAEGLGLGLPEDLHEGQQAPAPSAEAPPAPAPHPAPQPGAEPAVRALVSDSAADEPLGAGPPPSQQAQQQPAADQQTTSPAAPPPEGAAGEPVAAAAGSNRSSSEVARIAADHQAVEEAPPHSLAPGVDTVQPPAGEVPASGKLSSNSTAGSVTLGTKGRAPGSDQGDSASHPQAATALNSPAPAASPGEPDSGPPATPASEPQASDGGPNEAAAAATPDASAAREEMAASAPQAQASSVSDAAAASAEAAAPPPVSPQPEAPPAAVPSAGGDSATQHATATHTASPSPPLLLDALELPLAGLGPKGKGGGSVYELLVQEIKTTKLQQKLLARSMLELQRNTSTQTAELAADVASLAASLAKVRASQGERAVCQPVAAAAYTFPLAMGSHCLASTHAEGRRVAPLSSLQLPADLNMSGDELAARVDVLVEARLLHVSGQMLALQAALASSGGASPCDRLAARWLCGRSRTWTDPFPSPPAPFLPRTAAAKQQHALLCFLAMLGGVLGLSVTRFHEQWPSAKYAVLALAAANGLVGLLLQLQGGLPQAPVWLQALP